MPQDTESALNPPRQQTTEQRTIPPQMAAQPASPRLKTLLRRTLYRCWRALPLRYRRLSVRLAAPKATMGACAVILDEHGRVLLAHHLCREHPWGLPGGFVHTSEQPADGLARELREELGVQAQVGPVLSAEIDTITRQLTLYYRATLLGIPHEDGIEIDAFRYVAPEDVPRLLGDDADTCLHFMQTNSNQG